MSSTDDITRLRRKRGGIKKRLTDFQRYIQKIEVRLEKIKGLYDEFFVLQDEIEVESEEADDTEAQAFESNYFSAVSSAQVLIDDIKAVLKQDVMINPITSNIQGNLAGIMNHASTTGVKLPTMQLPKFNGKYTGWLEFRDAFDSLINKSEIYRVVGI
ncbi:hypothetical protein QE152_g1366 [Popillia japonica]|uniref:Uncharacterized protein n=1 Tax=Popillia japonica TaxID=7064 RepID=A0AAW1N7B9_POPJA